MTAKLASIADRIRALEEKSFSEPDGAIWDLITDIREERGLPPPNPLRYGFPPGRELINELMDYIRENAEEYRMEELRKLDRDADVAMGIKTGESS